MSRCLRAIDFNLSLNSNLVARRFVGEFLHKLVGLDVDVLSPLERLRGPHVASEELLSCCSSCLSLRLCALLSVVEDLLWVVAGRNDHGSIGAASEHSAIVHDVLGVVFPK